MNLQMETQVRNSFSLSTSLSWSWPRPTRCLSLLFERERERARAVFVADLDQKSRWRGRLVVQAREKGIGCLNWGKRKKENEKEAFWNAWDESKIKCL